MRILIFRTLLIYVGVLVAVRLMGKRQLGELQPAELVSTILISNLASISIESVDVPLTASLVPLFLITVFEILDSVLGLKFPWYAHLVSGRPKTIIQDGVVDQNVLCELRLSISDLMEALRSKDIFDIADVAYAIVETNGTINAAKKSDCEPLTRGDVALPSVTKKATVPLILDGQPILENLKYCEKNSAWLDAHARQAGYAVCDILLALCQDGESISWIPKKNSSCRRKESP